MNEAIKAIFYGACGSFLLIVLQYIYTRIKKYLLRQAVERFWEFGHRKIVIIHPLRHSPEGLPLDQNHIRVEDVIAMQLLISLLNDHKIEYLIQADFDEIPRDHDVVLLCSPKGNRQSKALERRFNLPFEIIPSKDSKTFFYREKKSGLDYESPKDKTNRNVDIALIARVTDQMRAQKFFLFWGVHGFGTLGAVKFAVNQKKLMGMPKAIVGKNFAVLISAPFSSLREVGEPNLMTQPQVFEG